MGRTERAKLPEFEPGGAAHDQIPGALVSDVNAAIEERVAGMGHSRRAMLAKTLGAGVGASAIGSVLAACGASSGGGSEPARASGPSGPNRKTITIGYPQVGGDSIQFFAAIAKGAKQAAADLGVKLDYRATGGQNIDLSAGQSRLTAAVVATKPTGLMTGFWDAAAMREPVESAVQQGTTVVTLNATPDVDKPSLGAITYVGQDERLAGEQAGARFKAAGFKKTLILNHDPSQVNISNRVAGFKKGFGGPTATVITPQGDPTTSANRIKAALTSHADADSIMGTAPVVTEFAVNALKSANKPNIKLATFDYSLKLLPLIASGQIVFGIDQQQYMQGYYPVLIITMLRSLGFAPVRPYLTGPAFVTAKEIDLVKQEIGSGVRSG